MVTKGIIKSIDYNGNTCKVRVPILESACDDAEIVLSAIFATTPGIFNGYKEKDVVIVSFEDNNYENAIILGKLYLGASKENEDPRGTVSCANLKSENQATIPLSSKLVYEAKDKNTANVKGSYNDYKTLADIVDGLQTQKTEIGSLNVKIIDDGENLGAEVAKKISITDETTKQRGLGWNLNTEKWEIYAKDTVGDTNSLAKLPIMTIDRTGMVISGNLVLTGYPQTTEIKYTNSRDKNTPPTGDDVEWKDSTSGLYQDTYYIWKRTREVFYSYNAEADKWELTKYGDAHYECITGAKGDPGYNTVTVMLYKRSKTSISGKQIDIDLYYKFSDQKLYIDDTCDKDYELPTGWSYTISGTGDSSNGDLYCIAAVAHSNTESDKILLNEWAEPTLYVENGADGQPGVYIKEVKQWYILWPADAAATDKPSKPGSAEQPEPNNPENTATHEVWMSTPPEAVNGYVVWTCHESIFSDDVSNDPNNRHIEYSDPVKDNAYALAQGKTTNYYSPTEPVNKIKIGDCWFDTGYVKITTNPENKAGYLGKFVVCQASTEGSVRVEASGASRYIPSEKGSTYLVKITPENIDDGLFTVKTEGTAGTDAYETGNLKQCSGFNDDGTAIWTDIAGELVTNKLTANYINALDITTKKITVLQDNNDEQSQILFKADGTSKDGTVKIGGFDVKNNTLTATDNISANLVQLMPDKILMQATKSAYWLKNTRTIEDAHSTYSYAYLFKYLETAANSGSWEDISKKNYDYRIYSKESPENNAVIVPYVEIYNKNDQYTATIFTFYYSYLNSVTPYKHNGNEYEIWIEALPKDSDDSPRRLLVPYGTTVINDGTYEYPFNTFITDTYSTAWTKLDNNSTYSNYIYDNYTTYYDSYESSIQFNGV